LDFFSLLFVFIFIFTTTVVGITTKAKRKRNYNKGELQWGVAVAFPNFRRARNTYDASEKNSGQGT
jgi:hypothetical protein